MYARASQTNESGFISKEQVGLAKYKSFSPSKRIRYVIAQKILNILNFLKSCQNTSIQALQCRNRCNNGFFFRISIVNKYFCTLCRQNRNMNNIMQMYFQDALAPSVSHL